MYEEKLKRKSQRWVTPSTRADRPRNYLSLSYYFPTIYCPNFTHLTTNITDTVYYKFSSFLNVVFLFCLLRCLLLLLLFCMVCVWQKETFIFFQLLLVCRSAEERERKMSARARASKRESSELTIAHCSSRQVEALRACASFFDFWPRFLAKVLRVFPLTKVNFGNDDLHHGRGSTFVCVQKWRRICRGSSHRVTQPIKSFVIH